MLKIVLVEGDALPAFLHSNATLLPSSLYHMSGLSFSCVGRSQSCQRGHCNLGGPLHGLGVLLIACNICPDNNLFEEVLQAFCYAWRIPQVEEDFHKWLFVPFTL